MLLPPPVQSAGNGTRSYAVNADDADDGVVTITAEFTHSNLRPDPIYFTNTHSHITVIYGDNNNSFANPITGQQGSGAITYSSGDAAVATVNAGGMVSILKAGTVTITAQKQADETYAPASHSYVLEINPKPVTVTGLTANNKVYDGTATATVTGTVTIDGKIGSDDVTAAGTATFADKNVGNGKAVTFSGWSLGGADAGNYTLSAQPASVTADITPKSVTITLSVADKAYDGTTAATVTGAAAINGKAGSDDVTAIAGTALFADKNVGNGKTVTFSGWSLGGADAGNYALSAQPASVTANITPKPLSLSHTGAAALSPLDTTATVTASGLSGADTATLSLTSGSAGLTFDSGTNTLAYNGTDEFTNPAVILGFSVSAAGGNYAATATLNISVFDGQANYTGESGTFDRRIPIRQGNITAFNTYALTTNGLTRHYKLTTNVDMNVAVPNPPAAGNWSAIGYYVSNTAYPFTGSFDGQGHTIANLTINSPTADYQGMFGRIGSDSIVQNVRLVGGGISGRQYIGGIAGWSAGTVQNCSTTGDVSADAGNVTSINGYVGGIVGYNDSGTVQNCHATGNVTHTGNVNAYAGGVVGHNNSGTVQYCYATGNVRGGRYYVGGVVGNNTGGTVEYCYATGDLYVWIGCAGGVVGDSIGSQTNNAIVRNCYATGDVVIGGGGDSHSIGGVVGSNGSYSIVQNCYATGNVRRGIDATTIGGYGANVGGVTGANGGTRNCVALNPSVLSSFGSNIPSFGRVAGGSSGLGNNYARADMVIQYGWNWTTNTSGTDKAVTSNLNGMDGLSITAAEYNSEAWWETIANWDTVSGSAWDFDTVWQWDSARNLPALRNVGE